MEGGVESAAFHINIYSWIGSDRIGVIRSDIGTNECASENSHAQSQKYVPLAPW